MLLVDGAKSLGNMQFQVGTNNSFNPLSISTLDFYYSQSVCATSTCFLTSVFLHLGDSAVIAVVYLHKHRQCLRNKNK